MRKISAESAASRPASACASLQTTLARAVTAQGVGAHGGRRVRLTLAPAPADSGVIFSLPGGEIEAHFSRVDAAVLRMRLAAGGVSVSTVEHLLAALAGLGVDNALVALDGDEAPAMDGSAAPFVAAIDEAGVTTLPAPRRRLRVTKSVRVSDGAGWAELAPAADGLHLDLEIAFAASIGRQRLALTLTPVSFRRELARARTFGFLRDAERLWRDGLALGASLDNTVVLDGETVLNPEGLRYVDEFVRHKMLDVVGDLALAGAPIIGAFRSYRGGHALNLALLRTAFARGALTCEPAEARSERAAIISPEESHSL